MVLFSKLALNSLLYYFKMGKSESKKDTLQNDICFEKEWFEITYTYFGRDMYKLFRNGSLAKELCIIALTSYLPRFHGP